VIELLVGVPFPPLAFEVMRFATPPAFFAETILSGATHPVEVALARRMVDELAEPPELLDRAIAAAETLAVLSPTAFAQTKQQIRQPVADAMERHGKQLDASTMEVWTASATLDHIRDYVSRTLKKN
jgi:enoyl-CoA hydratase